MTKIYKSNDNDLLVGKSDKLTFSRVGDLSIGIDFFYMVSWHKKKLSFLIAVKISENSKVHSSVHIFYFTVHRNFDE